jgi:hypothetical protein
MRRAIAARAPAADRDGDPALDFCLRGEEALVLPTRRCLMRRFVVASALLLMVMAAMPGIASAQGGLGAPDFKDRFTDEFVEENFCDTGASVQVVETVVGNVWERDGVFVKATFRATASFTFGDATIYVQSAGRDFVVTEGDVEGAHTELVTATGLRAALRVPGEGALSLDHGFIQFLATFDEDGEFVDAEVLREAGGHPAFQSEVFCDVAVAALGIPVP